jgi:hypothetical protein
MEKREGEREGKEQEDILWSLRKIKKDRRGEGGGWKSFNNTCG